MIDFGLSFHYHSLAAPLSSPMFLLFHISWCVWCLFPWFLTTEVAFSDLPWCWHSVTASIKDRLIRKGHVFAQNQRKRVQESRQGIDCLQLWNTSSASHLGSLGYDYWPGYALIVLLHPKSVTASILISVGCVCVCVCMRMCVCVFKFEFPFEKNFI